MKSRPTRNVPAIACKGASVFSAVVAGAAITALQMGIGSPGPSVGIIVVASLSCLGFQVAEDRVKA